MNLGAKSPILFGRNFGGFSKATLATAICALVWQPEPQTLAAKDLCIRVHCRCRR